VTELGGEDLVDLCEGCQIHSLDKRDKVQTYQQRQWRGDRQYRPIPRR
jgi:hypothetical protein